MNINLLKLQCIDLSGLKDFYSSLPGIIIKAASESELQMEVGSSMLIFIHKNAAPSPYYHFAFNVHPFHFKQIVEDLRSNSKLKLLLFEGSEIMDFHNWKAQSVYFLDPVGNIVEYIARERLSDKDSSQMVLALGEIAIAGPSVNSIVETLQKTTEIAVFDIGHDNFRALGDDDGLLIISSTRRDWFPTDIPVLSFPISAEITVGDQKYILSSEEVAGTTFVDLIT